MKSDVILIEIFNSYTNIVVTEKKKMEIQVRYHSMQ